jgi:hypothetical protein
MVEVGRSEGSAFRVQKRGSQGSGFRVQEDQNPGIDFVLLPES